MTSSERCIYCDEPAEPGETTCFQCAEAIETLDEAEDELSYNNRLTEGFKIMKGGEN